jgi:ABC-type multidrug transport system permease subunit
MVEVVEMREPNAGEYLFAERLLATEYKPRRRLAAPIWPQLFDVAILTSFLFFFFM